jgi:hypothetical protein
VNINKGFQVFGGSVNTGPTAVGDNARAEVHHGRPDPTAALTELRALLADREDLPEGTIELTERIATELGRPTPDRAELRRSADRLGALVADVAPVAAAVGSLAQAVAAAFGA